MTQRLAVARLILRPNDRLWERRRLAAGRFVYTGPAYSQNEENDPSALDKRERTRTDLRVALAHHALGPGKGIEHFVESADDDFSAVFPRLRPNQSDTRAKSRKHAALGMEELSAFIADMGIALDKITELYGQMAPIFLEEPTRVADQIKRVKEKLQEMNAHRAAIRSAYGG